MTMQAHDEDMYNENNSHLSDHVNREVNGNAKQHNVQCHNVYAVLQYNEKLAMLLQG